MSDFFNGAPEDGEPEIKPTMENLNDPYVLQLIARLAQQDDEIERLRADVKTHFEHGWNRGFHAGSAQANTLPSDWRGYQAILERESALKGVDDE